MFHTKLKTNIMLLLNVFNVIWVVSTLLINFVNYLPSMELFIKLLVLILLNRMELLKENIATFLNLLIFFYCMLQFQ